MIASAPARGEPRVRTLAERFVAAIPLLSFFFWICVLYMWEAWRHGSPWLFGDELQLTQLSRAIADTGHAARRGQPHSFDSLYTYYAAPAWTIHNVKNAYSAVKYLDVVAMTATIFPVYGLARFVVGRRAALFAAVASVLLPTFAFSAMIVEETVAYPYAALCLFLIAGAFLRRTRRWVAGAIVASLIAPAVRGELAVIPVVFALTGLFLLWRSDQVTRWRTRWNRRDWIGFIVLVIGAVILANAFMSNESHSWLVATRLYKHRIFTQGLWAAGAVMIELGVFPVVAGLASLWRAPDERYRYELRLFRSLLVASIIGFGWYTALKSAYLSTVFGTYVVERNLIYVMPLLLIGTAVWLERRAVHPIAAIVAGFATLYLVLTTPYGLLVQSHIYSQALGASMVEWLNRSFVGLTPTGAKVLLALVLLASLAILLVPKYWPRVALPFVALASAFVLVWGTGGELAAASASNAFSRSFLSTIHGNPTWLDDATNGASTIYLGQQIQDPNAENLLEFWNRSVRAVWSLDGTAPGPGPVLTPDVRGIHGRLYPDPHYPYLVAEPGIDPVGTVVARHLHRAGGTLRPWTLYRITEPLRLRDSVTGIYADGWSGPNDSAYTQYVSPGRRVGKLRVRVSWEKWPGPNAAHVKITVGTLVIGPDKEPHIGGVTATRIWIIHAKQMKTFVLPAPAQQFRAEVTVDPKFMPAQYIQSSDRRELGAQIQYTFIRASSPKRK